MHFEACIQSLMAQVQDLTAQGLALQRSQQELSQAVASTAGISHSYGDRVIQILSTLAKGRTRYQEPNMAHPPPSTTPTDSKACERRTWVDRVASLSNFRDHVPGQVPSPKKQQPTPSAYMTLMYNGHSTLSTTHYHAPPAPG